MSLCFPIATSHRQLLGKEPVMPREQMEHFSLHLNRAKLSIYPYLSHIW